MEINVHDGWLLIESCRRNEFTEAEVLGFIRKAWGEDVVSQSTVYRLYSQFGGGIRVSLESADRSDALGQAEQMKMLKQFQH